MTRSKAHASHNKIYDALNKLRIQASDKELELIELISSIYDAAKEKQEETIHKVKDTANSVNTSVHLHPWYYIGGAALCGLLTGLFLRR